MSNNNVNSNIFNSDVFYGVDSLNNQAITKTDHLISFQGGKQSSENSNEFFKDIKDPLSSLPDGFKLKNLKENFLAGKASKCAQSWLKLGPDAFLASQLNGVKLRVENLSFLNDFRPNITYRSLETEILLEKEVNRFLSLGIIEESGREPGDFVSNIFAVPKKDGTIRLILNLKYFNTFIENLHFKMDGFDSVLCSIKKNCFFYSLDIRDAFYSFRVQKCFRKYLKFFWKGKFYNFTVLPMGYCDSPRLFTRFLKAPLDWLRKKGRTIFGHLDDFLGIEPDFDVCESAIDQSVHLFDDLGFTIHLPKSILRPCQRIEFLGCIIDSREMSVTITGKKIEDIVSFCKRLLASESCTIRVLASLVGKLIACQPGVPLARLFYKYLEIQKDEALAENNFDFDGIVFLDSQAKSDLDWWIKNLHLQFCSLDKGLHLEPFSLVYETDASLKGWGGLIRGLPECKTGGFFSEEESNFHINILELLAVLFSLRTFSRDHKDMHIRLMIDNTTAVACINKKGSNKRKLHVVTRKIWIWALERNIWLSAAHIPGKENVEADFESRYFPSSKSEWSLKDEFFQIIMCKFGTCEIDLFASRLNNKLDRYVSFGPDPGAEAIDAFSFDWSINKLYIFPPFRLVGKILQKIVREKVEAVIVLTLPLARRFVSLLMEILVAKPLLIPYKAIFLPYKEQELHPS